MSIFNMRRNLFFAASVVIVLLLVFTGCSGSSAKLTSKTELAEVFAGYQDALIKYKQIELGMTHDEIAAIMGMQGELNTEQPQPVYSWTYDKIHVRITALFLDKDGGCRDTTFLFSSAYIFPETDARTTAEKYKQIKPGMTYDEVVSILGSQGLLYSSMDGLTKGLNLKDYGWWPEGQPEGTTCLVMIVNFTDGVVSKNFVAK